MKCVHRPRVIVAAFAALAAGCASTKHLEEAEPLYYSGDYKGARAAVSAVLETEDEADLGKPRYILDNLYAGSAALMCGDAEAAAEDFRRAGDGVAAQDASAIPSGYPTRAYDATMAANYRALALWMQGDADATRVAFRLVADAQDKAAERNARAIRKEKDALAKRKSEEADKKAEEKKKEGTDRKNPTAAAPASGIPQSSSGLTSSQILAVTGLSRKELEALPLETQRALRDPKAAAEFGRGHAWITEHNRQARAMMPGGSTGLPVGGCIPIFPCAGPMPGMGMGGVPGMGMGGLPSATLPSVTGMPSSDGGSSIDADDVTKTLTGNEELAAFRSDFDAWGVYGSYQIPSAWLLDAMFALANAEEANDLEHASFAARKCLAMASSKPARVLYNLAEKRADGKISARALDGLFVVVFENGLGPMIEEKRFDIPFPFDGAVYNASFALPKLVKRDRAYPKLVVRNGAVALGATEPVADIDRVAVKEFKARLPGIVASQIFEAAVKLAAQIVVAKVAEDKGGAAAKLVASAAASAASSAITGTDTRHWNLLPKEVQAVVLKKPKTKDREVALCVPGGVAPLATVSLPKKGLTVVYVKIPAPGLPPLVRVLGAPDPKKKD